MGNESDEDAFGRRVRQERNLRGWTQADLAKRLLEEGVKLHPSAIAKIEDRDREDGKPRSIRLDEATAIARVFGRLVDEMYETPEERNRMLYHRLRGWLERLSEPADEGWVIRDQVNEAIDAVEDDDEERERLRGLLRTDYLDKIVTGLDLVEDYLGVLNHPSRLWTLATPRKADEDDSEA